MLDYNTERNYIVGAYTTSPNLYTWNEQSELKYFEKLKELSSIRGLELPFWGESLHPFDNKWLLSNLDPKWENVLTCVPGTMKNLEIDPYFGLASKNEKSRINAIKFYKIAYECIIRMKKEFGEKSIIAIHITSSPLVNNSQVYADNEYFISSLKKLASWDWGNTKVLIEHCDAYNNTNLIPQKGFLSLPEEIEAAIIINNINKLNIGITINWGRSVIEFRNIKGPLIHINNAVRNNVLNGLIFSGTTNNNNNLYGMWSDLHMPPANYLNFQYFEKESLMSYKNIKNTLSACNFETLDCLGIKLLAMPSDSSIQKRISINRDTMILLDHANNEINNS